VSDAPEPATAVAVRLKGRAAALCRCYYYPLVDSTNIRVGEMAEDGAPEGTVVLADGQSRGKGQTGREFFSPAGAGLYLSVLLRSIPPPAGMPLITVAAAAAVSLAIEDVCAIRTQIKWVNDIYLADKKICGILAEGSFYHETPERDYVVLGVGINLFRPPAGFPSELSGVAGWLYEQAPERDVRGALAAGILNRFFTFFPNLTDRAFLAEYRRRSNILGRSVLCLEGERYYPARALDIDPDGGLAVDLEDGSRRILRSGEVRVRPLM
jgi:BirA family biotin operon repressor/biotin-[acetyl-CoA-carboxylase] ligase